MSLKNKDQILDNMYLVRFKILDEFYGDFFYDKYNGKGSDIKAYLKKTLSINDLFLNRNITYLKECGYLGYDEKDNYTGISMKGIKFVEYITDGKFLYEYQTMKQDENRIIKMFQENDELGGQ